MRPSRQSAGWATQSQEIAELRAELAEEHEKLLALQDINAASGTILNVDELLSLVASRITRVMECDRTTAYLLDDDGTTLVSRVVEGESSREIRLPVGLGLAGWVAKSGLMLNLEDAYRDARFDPEWDRKTGYRTRAVLCVPMKNRLGRPMGVIQCLNKHHGAFTVEDEAMLAALASQASVTIENGKFFLATVQKNMELLETKQQLERKVRELDVLMEIAQVAASAQRLDDLLEGVLQRAVRAIDAEAGSILLADRETGDLRFRSAIGGAPETVKRLRIPRGQGICGWVTRNRQPRVVHDVATDARHVTDIADRVGYHPRSVLAVPLFWGGGEWSQTGEQQGEGALELLNKGRGRGRFNEDDVRFATLIAAQISTAIQLAEARERQNREDRLSTIGQLLSSVLHDLKTPMAVIAGYTRELVEEPERAMRERFASSILRQVELVNAMTRETLAFARGDRSLWIRKVYLKQFFEELCDQLSHELDARGVAVRLVLEDRGIAHFDQHKVQRAIHNLARNAAEAIGEPGARTSAPPGAPRGTFTVRVSRRPDDAIVIECEDDGPGIPEEVRERLFESFATHGKVGGTGLGLAIVRKVVDDHGGTIEVESEPGKTVFRIALPKRDPADAR
ncbi:MAG: GAF domain-containing protein [Deltaproteobacteria bacterium]